MLNITGTSHQVNDDNKPTDEVTTNLPAGYYLELRDKAENPYIVSVPKDTFDTINELQDVLKGTTRFSS
jgi:hypothetical protein